MVRMIQSLLRHFNKLQATGTSPGSSFVNAAPFVQGTPGNRLLHNYATKRCKALVLNSKRRCSCKTIYYSCKHFSSTFEDKKVFQLPSEGKSDCDYDASSDNEHENVLEKGRQEVANLLAIGWQAPENISDFDVDHFLTLTTKKSRKKFLRFLCQKEMLKKKDKLKREERARQRAEKKETEGEQDEDVFENRILLRLQSNTILQFDRWRLAAGMKFGSKLVFDFSYEELMKRQEVISLVQQMMYVVNANKHAKDPFDIHWVGLTEDTQSLQQMKRMMKDSFQKVMVNVTGRDLLDVFPKEDLIYLSADSPNILKSYDPDKTYVIGALVDSHTIFTGQSLARAKRHGIDHARLPLDKHLQWTTGSKALTLDQMIKIMIDINTTGDWVKALQHVPIRKHAGLRSGPHWDQEAASKAAPKKRQQDGIHRNPSHFVSSRAGQSKARPQSRATDKRLKSSSKQTLMYDDDNEEDDSGGTVYSSRSQHQKSWFD